MTSWAPPRLSRSRLYSGRPESLVHDAARIAQIGDCFEQGHDVDVELTVPRAQQARLLQQHRGLEQVRDPVRFRNDVIWNGGLAVAAMRMRGLAQDLELRGRPLRIGQERRGQWPCARELPAQKRRPLRLG